MAMIFSIFLVHSFTLLGGAVVAAADCTVSRCKQDGPIIRFPFWLEGPHNQQQPDECTHPGFQLSCNPSNNDTELELRYLTKTSRLGYRVLYPLKASVMSINYTSRQINLSTSEFNIPIQQLSPIQNPYFFNYTSRQINLSTSEFNIPIQQLSPIQNPYFFKSFAGFATKHFPITREISFFNCSATNTKIDRFAYGRLAGDDGFDQVFMIDSWTPTFQVPLTSCTKMYNVSAVLLYEPLYSYQGERLWSRPYCGDCEAKGKYCKLENNSINKGNKHDSTTVCFPKVNASSYEPVVPVNASYEPVIPVPAASYNIPGKVVPGIVGGGLFLILLVLVALYYVIKTNTQKKQDQLKIEIFLADYKALKPTRYSYADIKKITNQFREKLGQGGYGSVYKGQLSNDILVAVKVLNDGDSKGNGEEFINEVSTIGLIHHINVVRLVGYCADGSRRALVYEFLPNNSLEKFVCSGKNHNNKFLGWERLQQIALGIAKGIEYLHQGCAQKILHFDIKPHNILLDQNFNPKLSDFGLAKLCSEGRSTVSMTMARGTIGYIAPEVFSRNFGKVSSKSDVYSFGMLLLEMVGANNNTVVGTENSDETYFPEWIFHRLEQGGELTIQIEDEVDNNTARKLTIVGLWCIGWHPVDRPSMKHVIQMLEGEDCPAIPPNPFSSTSSRNATATTHARPFTNELEAISESE